MLVVDASVIVKIFVPEDGSDTAARLYASQERLIPPGHAAAEVFEVLARKIRRGEIASRQTGDIAKSLDREFVAVPLNLLLDEAIEISLETGASVYDCLYVALASRERCRLVTADRRLIDKMSQTRHAPLLMPLDSFSGLP